MPWLPVYGVMMYDDLWCMMQCPKYHWVTVTSWEPRTLRFASSVQLRYSFWIAVMSLPQLLRSRSFKFAILQILIGKYPSFWEQSCLSRCQDLSACRLEFRIKGSAASRPLQHACGRDGNTVRFLASFRYRNPRALNFIWTRIHNID